MQIRIIFVFSFISLTSLKVDYLNAEDLFVKIEIDNGSLQCHLSIVIHNKKVWSGKLIHNPINTIIILSRNAVFSV